MNSQFDFVEDGGVTSPAGFSACGVCAGLKRSGGMDMALIVSDCDCSFAGTFTSNLFPAAPVCYDREICATSKNIRAVTVNSSVANACTGLEGYENSKKTAAITAGVLGFEPSKVLVASTGRIGVQLPMDKLENGIREAAKNLSRTGGSAAAHAIMTTDTRPKELAVSFIVDGKKVTVGGCCKGAGMIGPKMVVAPHATMLCFMTTDASAENAYLAEVIGKAVEASFNKITVDNDMSTNDTVVLMANGKSGVTISSNSPGAALFERAVQMIAEHLARSIVFDGEGVTKFVSVEVSGAANEKDAELCARAIANSPLCKTAWFGCDPNWGRILAAAGYSGAVFSPENVTLFFDEMPVVHGGLGAGTPESELAEILKRREFSVKIDLGEGTACCTIWTGDFTYDYVKINADYHT